jgi:hypothetical protein
MSEVTFKDLEGKEGEIYLYQRLQGPKREVKIVNVEQTTPGSSGVTVQFQYLNQQGNALFTVSNQNGSRIHNIHHFYEPPEETPKEIDTPNTLNTTTSEDPTEAGRRRRRRTSKRKSRRAHKRRTMKK